MRAYTLRRSRRSASISIRINGDKTIHVTAPYLVPSFMVDLFVKKQADWIEQQLKKLQHKAVAESSESILLFGKRYNKKNISDQTQPTGFLIDDQDLVYNNRVQSIANNSSTYTNAVARFLRQTAELYLLPKSHQLAKKMHVQFSKITLREQRSRWGSCSSQGSINFNWRLVHFAPVVIDYVIVHELAHLVHHNHSAQFWALVAKFAPEYHQAKKELQKFSIPVG
ncbi:MAG: SprT family zinc-dependent metalloprotease [bacterium]|nr:SprT family zinc-dependent metalloprotease [bacterium]